MFVRLLELIKVVGKIKGKKYFEYLGWKIGNF